MTSTDNPRDHAWKMMEKIPVCLFITNERTDDREILRARPMGVTVSRDENALYLLTNQGTEKEHEAEETHCVSLSFQNGNDFVVVAGDAQFSNDREKIREIFTVFAKAWWDSPDDPRIRLITVTPYEAEYWDSPGKLVSTAAMLTAAVTGNKPHFGENRKTAL